MISVAILLVAFSTCFLVLSKIFLYNTNVHNSLQFIIHISLLIVLVKKVTHIKVTVIFCYCFTQYCLSLAYSYINFHILSRFIKRKPFC